MERETLHWVVNTLLLVRHSSRLMAFLTRAEAASKDPDLLCFDSKRLDIRGNLWVAAGIAILRSSGEDASVLPGVYIITPERKLVGRIPIPEDVITNLAFGGPGRTILYVTAGKSIFTIPRPFRDTCSSPGAPDEPQR